MQKNIVILAIGILALGWNKHLMAQCENIIDCVNDLVEKVALHDNLFATHEQRLGQLSERIDTLEITSKNLKVVESNWLPLKIKEQTEVTHSLGKIPHGITLFVSPNENGQPMFLVDLVSYVRDSITGSGAIVRNITENSLVIEAGHHNVLDTWPVTFTNENRVLVDKPSTGYFKVVVWHKHKN